MSKYCRKCNREIPQNSKKDICENCQNLVNGKTRRLLQSLGGLGGLVVSVVLFVITKGKLGGPRV